MELSMVITIRDASAANQAQEVLDMFKENWNRAERQVAEKAKAEITPTADVAPVKPPTLEDARVALEAVVDKHSMADGIEILKSYGADKLSDLPEVRYQDFMTVCAEAAA